MKQKRFAEHWFKPDEEEGGIYAALDESGNVVPVEAYCYMEGHTPSIAKNQAGTWTVLTTFEEAIFQDDPEDMDWFETTAYRSCDSFEFEVKGQPPDDTFEFLIKMHSGTLKQAIRNHAHVLRLARALRYR